MERDLLLNWVLLEGAIGVAEIIADVTEPVEVPEVVLAVAVSFPVLEVPETDADVETSVGAAGVELVEVGSMEVESSCRGSGRTTPAKTTLRHNSRAKVAQIRWAMIVALILNR